MVTDRGKLKYLVKSLTHDIYGENAAGDCLSYSMVVSL
jgi:hypothetical protein